MQLVGRPLAGLVPFDEAVSHAFFGREKTRRRSAVTRRPSRDRGAGRAPAPDPLLIVVGDSGSGKSSLVRAGLLPRFRGGNFRTAARSIIGASEFPVRR
jgi:hypothetical protein